MAIVNKSKPVKDSREIVEEGSFFSPSYIKKFLLEVKLEASKIVWPEKKVTMSLTAVVIVLSAMVSFYLGTVDLLLGRLIAAILN